MSNTSWNPPTGPPNGAPVRPADARREIDETLDAARARDRGLRAELFALTTARVQASARLAAATDEVVEATSLAKRALTRSHESARAGQRADAARLTGAAQVFAMRLRDARRQAASLEREAALAAERAQRVQTSLGENIGWVQAVAAARLPMLSGRKANRAQHAVDEVVAEIAVPIDGLLAQATEAADATLAAPAADQVVTVSDDDLESEVDFEGTDHILDELRAELGLPAPAGASGRAAETGLDAPADAGAPSDSAPDPSSGQPRTPAPGSGRADRAEPNLTREGDADGTAKTTRSGPVPAAPR